MEKHSIIGFVGDDMDTMFRIVRVFPIEEIVLISSREDLEKAKSFEKDSRKFGIPVRTIEIPSYRIDEVFKITKRIADSTENEVIINASSGNKINSCMAMSAAFVNGIKAIGVNGDKLVMMPIMKFSYYKMLTDQKLRILKHLYNFKSCSASMEDLGRQVKMSLPLMSYHINGNDKSEGLKKMGLVDVSGQGKRLQICLSELGKMLMDGYV